MATLASNNLMILAMNSEMQGEIEMLDAAALGAAGTTELYKKEEQQREEEDDIKKQQKKKQNH
jgi:hypothetical protein